MSDRLQRLLTKLPEVGQFNELGVIVNVIRDIYDLEHVVYHAVTLGGDYRLNSTDARGRLAEDAGVWVRHGGNLLAIAYPEDWIARYDEANYAEVDPVLSGAVNRFLPIDWKTLDWSTAKRRQFLSEAVDLGLGNQGYTVPIRASEGQFALFTVNKRCSDDPWARFIAEFGSDLLVIAHFLHQRVVEIERVFGPPVTKQLSQREKDTLKYIGSGYNRAQIAHAMSISESTLRVYIDSARHKLGALNTPHAVALSINRGIVHI